MARRRVTDRQRKLIGNLLPESARTGPTPADPLTRLLTESLADRQQLYDNRQFHSGNRAGRRPKKTGLAQAKSIDVMVCRRIPAGFFLVLAEFRSSWRLFRVEHVVAGH